MQSIRRASLVAVLIAAFLAVVTIASPGSAERTGATASASRDEERIPLPWVSPEGATYDNLGDVVEFLAGVQRGEWYAGVQRQIDADNEWYAAVQRQIDAEARRAPTSGASAYHPGTTDGECSGFAIPSYIIQRESGGNPSAYNPSGAYGCAQTLLSHYSSGSCQGLDPYSLQGQRDCVWILSGGGTNLSPWAQTR